MALVAPFPSKVCVPTSATGPARSGGAAHRCAIGQVSDCAPPGASRRGAGAVRRYRQGREARRGDFEASSPTEPSGTKYSCPRFELRSPLNRDQPAQSIDLLASASPYERSYLEPVYLCGLAYLRLHKGAEAVAEFQKIVDHKGASWGATWMIHPYWGQFYSLSYLGMARGYALAGDTARARKTFQDLFELWKDADPDIPVVREAKAESVKQP